MDRLLRKGSHNVFKRRKTTKEARLSCRQIIEEFLASEIAWSKDLSIHLFLQQCRLWENKTLPNTRQVNSKTNFARQKISFKLSEAKKIIAKSLAMWVKSKRYTQRAKLASNRQKFLLVKPTLSQDSQTKITIAPKNNYKSIKKTLPKSQA